MTQYVTQDTAFLGTNSFWAFIGFVIFFIILGYLKVHHALAKSLDERAKRISFELEEARRLREEAQELLADYEKKRREAEKEAQDIIASAKRKAELMAKEMKEKTLAYMEQRRNSAEQKIKLAEQTALNSLRGHAVDIAANVVEKILKETEAGAQSENVFQDSLEELKKQASVHN